MLRASATVAIFIALIVPQTAIPSGPETNIRVRLYDYAEVPAPILAAAKANARRMLHRAGVNLLWSHCHTQSGIPQDDPVCDLPAEPVDLQLRIIGPRMARRIPTTPASLGCAWVARGFSTIASVYYHRAIELEQVTPASRAAILGGIIAHEIGHLLIGDGSHSARGIMRARWDPADFKLMARGQMYFLPEQAERIATNAAKRQAASTGGVITARHGDREPLQAQDGPDLSPAPSDRLALSCESAISQAACPE